MPSARDLARLPDIEGFRRLTRALAMLDAILSPEWESRYYSFDARWSEGEMMASMRNAEGDHWFALLCPAGVALHGLAHDAPAFRPGSPLEGIFDALPAEFHENFLREPAFQTEDSTFCVWRRTGDDRWSAGPVKLPRGKDPDGFVELASILAGDPKHYVAFAAGYYERRIKRADVEAVYRHEPLGAALVERLNPEVDLASLAEDMEEIGYHERG